MDKKTKKIFIVAIIIQAIVLGIIFLCISYKMGMLKSNEYKKAYIENHLETIYKNEMTYKKTKIGITGKKYIFTIDKAPEIEIATQYGLTINTDFLGEYLYDIGLKVTIRDNYKKEVLDYLLDKYINKNHTIDITNMNKFQALDTLKETFLSIKDEANTEYYISIPDNFSIRIKYYDEEIDVELYRLDMARLLKVFLDNFDLPNK